jgi:hypothetical protein
MGDSEEVYQDPAADDTSEEEGSYAEPGAYTNPDGTTGYSGTQSGGPSDPVGEEGDYPASVGATLSVGLLGIGLVGEGVVGGLAAAGVISAGTAETLGFIYMGGEMGAEGTHAIFGDD